MFSHILFDKCIIMSIAIIYITLARSNFYCFCFRLEIFEVKSSAITSAMSTKILETNGFNGNKFAEIDTIQCMKICLISAH